MKKIFSAFLISVFLVSVNAWAAATEQPLKPIITANNAVRVKNNIIFDASASLIPPSRLLPKFSWDFGDKTYDSGSNVVHTYREPGLYTVKLTVTQGQESATATHEIFAYQKRIILLTDMTAMKENIDVLSRTSRQEGTYIDLIESYDSTTSFLSEESFTKKLAERGETLGNADGIISWTASGAGLGALSHLSRGEDKELATKIQEALKEKTIVVLTDKNFKSMARTLRVHFNIIRPKRIVITRESEIKNFLTAPTPEAFLEQLQKSLADHQVIDEETGRISLLNSISYLVNFMIIQGIPTNTIVLLLMLPVIATLIALIKQVIGITTFGLYLPSIIALSFLALGLKFGLTILITLIVTGVLLRKILDWFPLLHIPRMAIILTISTFIILLMLAAGTYLGISRLATIAVFPMLIMMSLAEKFVGAVNERGALGALFLMLETTAVSLLCYWVVEWQSLQTLMLGYPELILVLILINYLLGRWTGLRLTEYLRFKSVMKYAEEEE